MDWHVRGRSLPLGKRTLLMGIVNVTPDSFSDGGRHPSEGTAYAHAMTLQRDGAHLLDIGGESTRPGATPVPEDVELHRVLPVVKRLASEAPQATLSIDTSKASVADACLAAGAHVINDVTAGRDPRMFEVVARHGAGIILMHMQGTPQTMQQDPRYDDVVKEVAAFLVERARAAQAAGVARERIVIDPGLGFGKTVEHNVALLRGLRDVRATGYPVMVGASRKGFLGTLTTENGVAPSAMDRREAGLAAHVAAVANGADVVRVHNVRSHRRAFAVADPALRGGV